MLAGLRHPGIARLLDGGVTGDGLPYLAMELVEGEPITAYAQGHGLSVRARLDLFLQACDAVAHAHRHLVVHRDLKPAHILVAPDDEGRPHVKLLDFGIAKLLDTDDGFTQTGGGPMTPQYAAPEQLVGGSITTATDVYALGVILYELLTGQAPYRVSGLTPSEAERLVASTPPTRPSATASGPTASRLRGDLDTIVLKALSKEPDRRYASAEAFADDIGRYLDGLPVRARPDSWRYRASKFARRHRTPLAAAAVACAALVGGTGVALWQAREARAEAAKARTVQDFLFGMLAAANPDVDGRDVRVADLLDRAAATIDSSLQDQPEVRGDAHLRLGRTYYELGLLDEARAQLRLALRLHERLHGSRDTTTALTQRLLGTVHRDLAAFGPADSLYALALATFEDRLGAESLPAAATLAEIATLRYITGDSEGSAEAHRRVLAVEEASLPANHPETLISVGNLAVALFGLDLDESTALLERQVAMYRAHHPGDEEGRANALANLGAAYAARDRMDDAAEAQTEAVALFRSALGDAHPSTAFGLSNLGSSLTSLGRADEAEPLLREAVAIYRSASGERHPNVGYPLLNLAKALRDLGRIAEAERAAREAVALFSDGFGEDHPAVGSARETLEAIGTRRRAG